MKSLTILSCYPGGKKIQKEFNITSKLDNHFLEEINYPIMLLGSTLAPVTSNFWLSNLPPFQNTNVSNLIYLKQKLYGPNKIDGEESFITFFKFLNQDTTYEKFQTTIKNKAAQHYRLQDANKKLPAIETFSHAKPSYLYAANVFANIYNDKTKTMNPKYFANYVLIKFPHTSWFTPARFKKLIIKLSQITTLTTDIMIIPQSTQAILMDTNNIPAEIILQGETSFIPAHYLNQNYVFNNITVTKNISLSQFVKQFFTIEQIAEPINIVIKELSLGTELYTNVYIFIHNNFGTKDLRNGYIVTNATKKTLMTSWDNSQSFEFNKQIEEYTAENVTNLILKITENATKQFSSTTKIDKTYDIETSGAISQEKIKVLENNIKLKQKSDDVMKKAKNMLNQSVKEYEAEQKLKIINALELVSMLNKM